MASQVALTSVDEVREDTERVMKSHEDWGAYLTPAPLSINLMGELVFISASQHDFSISKNPPRGGFKYIKHPESFRASLMQVCNTGWDAFNEAHKNMDQIRFLTARVPDYIKAAVDILFNGSDKIVEKLLPLQLESIGTIADTCVTPAESTENKCMEVIKLIEELLEASVNADTQMTQVKTQWTNMLQFFQMISHIVSISFKGKVIKDFVDTATFTRELSHDDKRSLKGDLYEHAFKASNLAGLVNMLSGTYMEVSHKFLMDRVNNLGELMAIDKDDKEFQAKREKMHKSCQKAREGIRELVEKNKKEYDEKTKARMLKIEGGLKAVLPAQPEETDRIREITQ